MIMRMEWKFRGWDATGQKGWVFGDLVHNQKVTKTGLEPRTMVGGYEVVPDSVCLCTGIKAVDGTMIYEGDIISIDYEGKHLYDATVVWVEKYGGFMMDEEDDSFYSPIPNDYVTVIGSVYEQRIKDKR